MNVGFTRSLLLAGLACLSLAPTQAMGAKPARPAKPKLSSAYVDLHKCENLWKAPEGMPEGSDEPIECAAPGGYTAGEQYSAATTWHIVSHAQAGFQVSLVSSSGTAWSATPVMEFRLCGGRPFAVIQRIQVRDAAEVEDETCSRRGCGRNLLVIEGLIGLEGRHAEIPAGPKANEEARQAADAWVAGQACPAPPPKKP